MPAKDVTQDRFVQDVIERSYERPVVVDFWAEWCAPCRQLGPILERTADRHAGEVELVKLDVDANPEVAAAYGIQGIPAVKAFRDGVVVEEFVGAYPEQAVQQFFDAILPTEADRLAAKGAAATDLLEAERLYRVALDLDRDQRTAVLGLASILADRREYEEARALLARLPDDADVRRLRARIELEEAAAHAPESDPLAHATSDGDWEPVLERLLEEVRTGDRDRARQQMVDVFEVLGPEHPLTQRYRSELASALF
ncbi:MAG: thioredoxin [Actinobacteria bacterium]|nr:MAG: thioredoxin [Actinomycetota bacterium]